MFSCVINNGNGKQCRNESLECHLKKREPWFRFVNGNSWKKKLELFIWQLSETSYKTLCVYAINFENITRGCLSNVFNAKANLLTKKVCFESFTNFVYALQQSCMQSNSWLFFACSLHVLYAKKCFCMFCSVSADTCFATEV